MNILIINWTWYPSGGDWTYISNLIKIYESQGHTVIPFSQEDERNITHSKYFVSKIDFQEFKKKKSLKFIYKVLSRVLFPNDITSALERLLSENKIDLVHLNNLHHHLTANVVSVIKKRNIPIVWTLHDYVILCPNTTFTSNNVICEECKLHKYYKCVSKRCKKGSMMASVLAAAESYSGVLKNIYPKVDRFVCPSEFIRGKFIEYGFPPDKLVTINNSYIPKDKDLVRVTNTGEEYILYFGNVLKVKGVKTLIDAVAPLKIKLLIAGDGENKDEYERYVVDSGFNNIQFIGRKNKEELSDIIKKSLFVVVPSEWYENFPYSVVEAMFFGKAVVGSKIGGIPELVLHEETGLLFESFNEIDLRANIVRLLNDRELLKRVEVQAYHHVNKICDNDLYKDKLRAVLTDLGLVL
jgi:glycosyltransferase involved in cell wall biosynthesis